MDKRKSSRFCVDWGQSKLKLVSGLATLKTFLLELSFVILPIHWQMEIQIFIWKMCQAPLLSSLSDTSVIKELELLTLFTGNVRAAACRLSLTMLVSCYARHQRFHRNEFLRKQPLQRFHRNEICVCLMEHFFHDPRLWFWEWS